MTENDSLSVDQRAAVNLFLHSLTLLRTDDDGLELGHDRADFNAIAFLCGVAKAYVSACRTVEDFLLYQLADATEALIVSSVVPTDNDVVGLWWKARADVVNCQLGGLSS
jgi:hypothetical protein